MEKKVVVTENTGESDQLNQKPVKKKRLLKRLRAKLGVRMSELGRWNKATGKAPSKPDNPVVPLTKRRVHQGHFIDQEWNQQKQQGIEKQLTDRTPEGQGYISEGMEDQQQRPSPAEAQEQCLVRSMSRQQMLSVMEVKKRRLGVAEVGEQNLWPAEALEWRLSSKEAEESGPELSESKQWEKSSSKAQEQNVNPVEPQKEILGVSEIGECRLSPEEENKGSSDRESWTELRQRKKSKKRSRCKKKECRLSPGEFPELSPVVIEVAEMRLNPEKDIEKSSRQREVQKWNSGKALEWSHGMSEAQEQKPEHSDPGDKKLGIPGVKAGGGRTEAAEKEAGDGGRVVSSLRGHYSGTKPCPPKKVVTKDSEPQHPLPPSASLLPPAPANPQPPWKCLFHKKKFRFRGLNSAELSFIVNPWQSRPLTAPSLPKPQFSYPEKKYPTVEEITVIGGYVSLSQSCLAKKSSKRCHKQLKISFNESALETIYYYPSEKSMLKELKPLT